MAKGARLYPLGVSILYEKLTKELFALKDHDSKEWLKDYPTFIDNKDEFEVFLNDVSDSQWMTVMKHMQAWDRIIDVPYFGKFMMSPVTYRLLKSCNFDIRYMRATYTGLEVKALHKAFWKKVKADRFLKLTNKSAYDKACTEGLADLLQRRAT